MATSVGPYRLLGILGRGASGSVVYRARRGWWSPTVALKIPGPATQYAGARTLLRELAPQGRIRHPRIIPILRLGLADGLVYVVMEHLRHGTLHDFLAGGGRLTAGQAATVVTQVAEALEHVGSAPDGLAGAPRPIVHRDVTLQSVHLDGSAGGAVPASSTGPRRRSASGRSSG